MPEFNPYAAPEEQRRGIPGADLWREGIFLVGTSPMALPHRCFLCNADAEGMQGRRYRKTMYYVSPWICLLLLIHLIVLVIVYLAIRKPIKVECSLCDACIRKRRWRSWGLWASLLAVVAGIAAGIKWHPGFSAIALVGLISLLVFMVLASYPLRVKRYRKPEFLLKGAGDGFLSEIDAAAARTA